MWHILEDEYFARKLYRLRSNAEVIGKYREASFDLTHSTSPESRGDRKRGRLSHSYVVSDQVVGASLRRQTAHPA